MIEDFEIRQYREEVINNVNKENDKKKLKFLAEYSYQTNTLNRILKEATSQNEELTEYVKRKLADNGLLKISEEIFSNIDNYITSQEFREYVKQGISPKTIFILYTKFNSNYNVDIENFNNIIDTIFSITWNNEKEHGQGELLCALFIKNCRLSLYKEKGDIIANENGILVPIEIKKDGGRIKGQEMEDVKNTAILEYISKVSGELDNNLISKLISGENKRLTTSGPNGFKDITKYLAAKNYKNSQIYLIEYEGVFSQLAKNNNEMSFKLFANSIDYNINLSETVYRYHGILSIMYYKISSSWNELWVFNMDKDKCHIIDYLSHIHSPEDITCSDYENLYNDKHLAFKNGPDPYNNSSRSKVCSVSIK